MSEINFTFGYQQTYTSTKDDIGKNGGIVFTGAANSTNKLTYKGDIYNLTKLYFDTGTNPQKIPQTNGVVDIIYVYDLSGLFFEYTKTDDTNTFFLVKIPITQTNNATPDTYSYIRTFLGNVNNATNSDKAANYDLSLHSDMFKEDEKSTNVKLTQLFANDNGASGIVMTLANLEMTARPSLYTIEARNFYPPNLVNASFQTNKNVSVNYNISNNVTCKRKANTGVINNTIMGGTFSDALIKANTDITIATIVMLFLSLLVITIFHLLNKADNTDFFGNPIQVWYGENPSSSTKISGAGLSVPTIPGLSDKIHGGYAEFCKMSDGKLQYGFGFFVILLIAIIQIAGSASIEGAELMSIAGVVILIVGLSLYTFIVKYGLGENFNINDLGIEHFFLIDPMRPASKWYAISSHMVWMSTFNQVNTKTIDKDTFIGLHVFQVLLAFLGVFVYWYEDPNFKRPFINYVSYWSALILVLTIIISSSIVAAATEKRRNEQKSAQKSE
jgi:hypothetical protein